MSVYLFLRSCLSICLYGSMCFLSTCLCVSFLCVCLCACLFVSLHLCGTCLPASVSPCLCGLVQALIGCVGGRSLSQAVGRCVCSDDLPTTCHLNAMASTAHLSKRARLALLLQRRLPWLVSGSRVMAPFSRWWQRAVLRAGPDPQMTKDVYDRLLAR